jgi:hypothetical protein
MARARHLATVGALLLAGLCAAAAHARTAPREIRPLLDDEVARRSYCVDLPHGEFATIHGGQAMLDGFRHADGSLHYPDHQAAPGERIRETYDLLVTLGLFGVEERLRGRGTRRTYRPTPFGERHVRTLFPAHSGPAAELLCFGSGALVAFQGLDAPVRVNACEEARTARYSWRYVGLPLWMEDPRLRAAFPDLGTRREASRPREGYTALVRYGAGNPWMVRTGDPLVRVICLDEPRAGRGAATAGGQER